MHSRVVFITGSDTGVGKTVVTALLARHLARRGVRVAALKPLASGDRADAEALRAALGDALPLEVVNPWHFRAALAPAIAARQERRRVALTAVVAHIRAVAAEHELTLVEGAGGLLSPLGEDFAAPDLIRALRAQTLVVCANRLGVINQARLVLTALPKKNPPAPLVLVEPAETDPSTRTNVVWLRSHFGANRVHSLPRVTWPLSESSLKGRAGTAVQSLAAYLTHRDSVGTNRTP